MKLGDAVIDERRHRFAVFEPGAALECAEADMAVGEADEDRAARRRGLIIAFQGFAGLDQAEGFGGVDAEGFEVARGEDFPHAALEGQPAIAAAGPGRLARAFRAEIEEAAGAITQLRKEEAATVAEVWIVGAELVAVIPHGQGLGQVAGQRFEPAEMSRPRWLVEPAKPNSFGPALVAPAQHCSWKVCGADRIGELRSKRHEGDHESTFFELNSIS